MVKIPRKKKFLIALCSQGYGIFGMIISSTFLYFYTKLIGLEPIVYGIAILIYGIWNGINDIFIGYYSDKLSFHTKKGKRKRLMKWSSPLAVISFFLLIFNQPTWNTIVVFILLVIGLCIFDLAVTLFSINYGALLLEISEDPDERGTITVLNNYINFVPMTIISLIPLLIDDGAPIISVVFIYILFGMISVISISYSFNKVEEPFRENKKEPDPIPPFTAIIECLKIKSFRYNMIIGFTMSGLGSFGPTAYFLLGDVYQLTSIAYLLPPVIAGGLQPLMFPIILKIQKKIGFRKTFLIFLMLAFVGYLGLMLVVNYVILCICYILILTVPTAHSITRCGFDPVPIYKDYLEKGNFRAGMFGGVTAIFTMFATHFFVFIFTIFLESFGFNVTPNAIQTEEAKIGIRLGMCLLPLIALAITSYIMYKYPLNEYEFAKLMKNIQAKYGEDISYS